MPGAVWTRQSGPTGSEQMEAALRKHLAQHPLDRYLLSAKELAVACGGSETQDGVVKETNVWDAVMEDRRELARILSVGARKLKKIVEECQKQVGVKRTQEAIQNFLDSGKYTESHDLGVNYLVVRAKQISRENRERHEAPNPMGGNLDFADKERLPTEYVENLSDHPDVACEDGSLRRIQEEG
jgi:hypothetical protein